jgi:hypothetical protein
MDQLRDAGGHCFCHGADAAVMHHGRAMRKQRLKWSEVAMKHRGR